ncbi:MAG: hypothetical protein BWX55_00072 [Deltaproteobacteria bacterium ADurb.Bin022]|jgi:hypothetical protein|nr:MAG: hypothetical protein BWX55_00072 [Deltaproteobacteria bacterium ADurb.Bin022]
MMGSLAIHNTTVSKAIKMREKLTFQDPRFRRHKKIVSYEERT